jgi:hypothetical protein
MLARQPYMQRVAAGKALELRIFRRLRQLGWHIRPANNHEDMHSKIDAWLWLPHARRWASLQIKCRENGPDIICEVYKDLDKRIPGRDMVGQAELYCCVDPRGNGRILNTSDAHKHIRQGLRANTPYDSGSESSHPVELRVTRDRCHGQRKLMAFLDPRRVRSVYSFSMFM